MPWTETRIMDTRLKFVSQVLEGIYNMAELCRAYDISRKTGYKWLNRYESQGPAGLCDRSKAPHNHPNAIREQVKQAILSVKGRFSHWGPAKIRVRLQRQYPHWSCYPAVSTIGQYLKRQGLVCSRKRRHRASPTVPPLMVGSNSNDVWTADFKGHFRTGDGHRCNPLTISDDASRYLLCCRHLERMSYELVRMQSARGCLTAFERVFREYGLPLVVRTDNGEPFSSIRLGMPYGRGLCGLSRLSCWWIRLGIHPERIMSGHPEHNGRQQKQFDLFSIEYNEDRPHEVLDMHTPTSHYKSSARFYPAKVPEVCYSERMKVCRVFDHGDVYYCGRRFFVTECLSGEYISIEQIEEYRSRLWYFNYELGTIDHQKWLSYAGLAPWFVVRDSWFTRFTIHDSRITNHESRISIFDILFDFRTRDFYIILQEYVG